MRLDWKNDTRSQSTDAEVTVSGVSYCSKLEANPPAEFGNAGHEAKHSRR